MLKLPTISFLVTAFDLKGKAFERVAVISKTSIRYILLLSSVLLITCGPRPAFKNIAELSKGDTQSIVLEKWGKPMNISKIQGPWGENQLWVYNCLRYCDCRSNWFFEAPCYFLYFENGKLISISDYRN